MAYMDRSLRQGARGVVVAPANQEHDMKVEVRFHGLEASEELRVHAARRVHQHLSRFGQQLSAVVVRIADVNGPKGGLDKRCQVTVRGPRLGTSTFEGLSGDPSSAVDAVVERVARAVGRALERVRSLRQRGRSLRGAPSFE